MKPIIILPPNAMSEDDIKIMRDNGLCVVTAEDPSKVQFVDPIPSVSSRTDIEDAAIKLSRKLLTGDLVGQDYRKNITALYVDLLISGTKLDPKPSKEEIKREHYDSTFLEETRKIAREDARAEKDAEKARKAAEKAAKQTKATP